MYYASGNYEAFHNASKSKGADRKSAYIIGSGLAGLSAAAFLVRDAQLSGKNIHILERDMLSGGACDGIKKEREGFVIRGGREMENHFECLWDLFRSVPSAEEKGSSVLDEYYRLNVKDPNYSLMRATVNRGEDAHTDGKFALSDKAALSIAQLFMTKDEDLYDKSIEEVLDPEFFESNFWLYWKTMFAFNPWHSALEMKLYIQRFVHHIGGLPDFSALKFTKYNQYESLILPLENYLRDNGVQFIYGIEVENVLFDIDKKSGRKVAKKIVAKRNGISDDINLTEDDLVFITNGSCTDSSSLGDNDHAPVINVKDGEGDCWNMWKNIASQCDEFGHPEKFCGDISKSNWESATVTTLDNRIPEYLERICKRDPFSGKVVTGGIISVKDSSWMLSYTFNRQPHFKAQKKNELVGWIYALYTDVPGDYIKKPMKECTGTEICEEWLYHMGVPVEDIHELASTGASTIPCMMPYITAFFMPRRKGDRPAVVPENAINFAFIGQFAETRRDTIFTTEYSVRTGMEAVYTLMDVDRAVPEVWGSCYDVRSLLDATSKMMDGKKLEEVELPFIARLALKEALKKTRGTLIEELLARYNLI